MNFNVTAVFSPLERAELKKQFHQKKKIEAQNTKVSQQAVRSYKSTVEVKRISRRQLAVASMESYRQEQKNQEAEETPVSSPSPPQDSSS
jgi:ABC-type phosphate transport system auxiliary subunit